MRTFRYKAYTPQGRPERGVIMADSEQDASERISAKGLFPSEILEQDANRRTARRRERTLNHDLLTVFTRQIAVLLSAGLTAEAALEAVQHAGGSAKIEALAIQARAALLEGEQLADALNRDGNAMPSWYTAAVRAGEMSGELASVFDTLADYLESSAGDRAAITSALIYPAFVTIVALAVCAILMTTVAPEIVAMFETSGRPLPPLTVAVMAIFDALRLNWEIVVSIIVTILVGLLVIARTPTLRDRRDTLLLKMPLVGHFMRMNTAAQYLRTLSVVINSKIPLTDGLRFAADVVKHSGMNAAATQAGEAIFRGETLSRALERVHFLHPVARQLIEAGEASARLGHMTERAAILTENWLKTERKRVTVILEPAAMIVVGAVVLTIVLAILLPIFDMQALVAG